MANFSPIKNYIVYCLRKLIDQYHLTDPFLDAGCGIGDVSLYLAKQGWSGTALDFSASALEKTKQNLADYPNIKVVEKSLLAESGCYQTIFLLDVIEHVQADDEIFKQVFKLLDSGGYLVLTTPSHPQEWRWDDQYYGHLRRYSVDEIKSKLIQAGLQPLVIWDFTYPVFWLMRRLYTKIKRPPKPLADNSLQATKASSLANAWNLSLLSKLIARDFVFWKFVYWLQFKYFKHRLNCGHEILVLARKF